ncbi:hypothetical protein HY227_00950 [Candidatus Wolfebacteria bacterium]|nr:hypothetical protein [Candidatus Wolfebacteria bacterium]
MFSKFIKIFRTFTRNEKLLFGAAFLIFLTSFIFMAVYAIGQRTIRAAVPGGEYKEGVIGQPAFINPILLGGELRLKE